MVSKFINKYSISKFDDGIRQLSDGDKVLVNGKIQTANNMLLKIHGRLMSFMYVIYGFISLYLIKMFNLYQSIKLNGYASDKIIIEVINNSLSTSSLIVILLCSLIILFPSYKDLINSRRCYKELHNSIKSFLESRGVIN